MDPHLFNLLRASLDRIPVVDTHEDMGRLHPLPSAGIEDMLRRLMPREAARLFKRTGTAASPSGVSALRTEGSTAVLPSLAPVNAFLSTIRNTLQYRYILAAFVDLFSYHSAEISEATSAFLTAQIVQKTADPKWPRTVLCEKANIELIFTSHVTLTPQFPAWAQGLFVPLFWVDHLLFAATAKGRQCLERRYNISLKTVDELFALIERLIRTAANSGFAGLKSRLASFRTLHIENVAAAEAKSIFDKRGLDVSPHEVKRFQDFVFHAIVQCSVLHKLPIQIDAGLDGAGACGIERANPLHLTDMIFNYADARFAVLHGGFPFTGETAVMAKTFPNIYLDGSWLHHASAQAAKAVLHEWLEVVPCGKIMLWGGNSRSPEASYLSLLIAKDILAEVLAEKVESGYFSEGLAVDIAWKLLRENARSLYRLSRLPEKPETQPAAAP